MGLRGPAPKPTALKILHNDPNKARINREEPTPEGDIGPPPARLSLAAKRIWTQMVAAYAGMGVLTAADRTTLLAYSETAARVEAAIAHKANDRDFIALSASFRALARELGASPAARTAIRAPQRKPKDDLADFIG